MSKLATQEWERRGLVFAAPGTGTMRSHAMLPTPLVLDDRIRVYIAACDEDLRGRIFRVDLDRDDPRRVIEFDRNPVLDLGPTGTFDEHGVNPSQIVVRDGRLLLYYIGWQRISTAVPYTLFAGLAASDDGGLSFHRSGSGQILHATPEERFFRTAPFVFPARDGWGMLYIGGGEFFDGAAGKRLPTYSLRQTYSADGCCWDAPTSPPLLNQNRARGEIGWGRPVLWQDGDNMTLIISSRTEDGYTLRVAAVAGGTLRWSTPLRGVAEEWESAMTGFGSPCRAGDWDYLFYNGNQFGRSGFGVARRPAQGTGAPSSPRLLIATLEKANREIANSLWRNDHQETTIEERPEDGVG